MMLPKFRGMDANGVMRYGRLSQDKPNSTKYYKDYSQRICWDDSNIPVSNKTLGQFIGLTDKNGLTKEQIHHINGNTRDNRIGNLQLITIEKHTSLHHKNKETIKKFNCIFKNCTKKTNSKYRLCTQH